MNPSGSSPSSEVSEQELVRRKDFLEFGDADGGTSNPIPTTGCSTCAFLVELVSRRPAPADALECHHALESNA
jgi:hypothetical protein